MCMNKPYLLMSLLILDPKSSGNDIDVFLRPSIDGLKKLCEDEVCTNDASILTLDGVEFFPSRGSWCEHKIQADL